MDKPRRQAEAPPARQQRLDRAKRALIAGYLHSLSDRHGSVTSPATNAGHRPSS